MVSKKYIKDYRLDYIPDKKGNLKAVPVYEGKVYCFQNEGTIVKKAKWYVFAMLLVSLLMYIIPLLLEDVCLKKFYVMVPYAFLVFPVFFAFCGFYRILTAKEENTREHKDKAQPRLKASSFVCLLLSFLSLVGQVVYAVKERTTLKNFVVMSCTVLFFVSFLSVFMRCGKLIMKEK